MQLFFNAQATWKMHCDISMVKIHGQRGWSPIYSRSDQESYLDFDNCQRYQGLKERTAKEMTAGAQVADVSQAHSLLLVCFLWTSKIFLFYYKYSTTTTMASTQPLAETHLTTPKTSAATTGARDSCVSSPRYMYIFFFFFSLISLY